MPGVGCRPYVVASYPSQARVHLDADIVAERASPRDLAGTFRRELQARFVDVIDTYLSLCGDKGIESVRPFSDSVAFRFDSILYARVAAIAQGTGASWPILELSWSVGGRLS